MPRFRSMAVGCAIAVVAASGAMVVGATDAGAKLIRTTISLAEFKSVYGLASLRKMVDNGGGRLGGIVVYSQRLDSNGVPIKTSGKKADLTKSFLTFRVDTSVQDDPVSAAFQLRVVRKPFSSNTPEILTCSVAGDLTAGIGSLTCGGGPTVSPT